MLRHINLLPSSAYVPNGVGPVDKVEDPSHSTSEIRLVCLTVASVTQHSDNVTTAWSLDKIGNQSKPTMCLQFARNCHTIFILLAVTIEFTELCKHCYEFSEWRQMKGGIPQGSALGL